MNGSGKQILLRILRDLSGKKIPEEFLEDSTDRIRAGLLLHGSTSEENFEKAKTIRWANSLSDGALERQGLAAQNGKVFLSDFFERMLEMPELQSFMVESYDGFKDSDYEAAVWALWALVSAPQMFSELLDVEAVDSELELEAWIEKMTQKYETFFGRR